LFALEGVRNEQGEVVDMTILKINKAFTRILKLGEEVVGQRYLSVFPGAKAAGIFDLHVQVLKTGVPIEHEFYYNGEGHDGWFRIAITRSGENSLIQTFTDSTESMRNKLSLEQSAAYLQNVIDSSQTGIFLAAPVMEGSEIIDFRFKTVNKALAAFAFKQPPELIGGSHSEIFPVSRQNGVFEIYKEVCETGKEVRFERRYTADGFDVWLDVWAKKLGDDLLVTFHDFTPIKQLQLKLQASIDDLKKSNERLTEFAHVASHDLKEPLRKVRLHTNLLEQRFAEALGEQGYQHVLRIQSATLRMQALITDLLTYSQVSKRPDSFETLSLQELVHEVLNDLEVSVQTARATVCFEGLPQVNGNAMQLRQLFQNLLSNALKFTHADRPCEITITSEKLPVEAVPVHGASQHKFYYRIDITDNGIGFEQQYADKVFKIFQRLHSRDEYEGTGIGLAIVQKVVENHHGFIRAESEPGKGTTFSVYLPV
jgi:signal transduction histidine kinase